MNSLIGVSASDLLDELYGNDTIKEYISSSFQSGSLSHAYIFEGGRGSGRHTLVRLICHLLAPEYVKKIDEGISPDILVVSREGEKKFITVDQIRDMKERAVFAPSELECTIFIIEDADSMNVQAQNALLKLLEEPPKNIYIFLLCESVNGLLPTIISRAPIIRMEVFEDDKIKNYLLENNKKASELAKNDPEAFDYVVRCASGHIGEAIRLLDLRTRKNTTGISVNAQVISMLEHLASHNKSAFFLSCAAFPQKREELDVFFSYFESALRDILCEKSGDKSAKLLFFADTETADVYTFRFTMGELYRLVNEVTEIHEAIFSNVNIRLSGIVFANRAWKALTGS